MRTIFPDDYCKAFGPYMVRAVFLHDQYQHMVKMEIRKQVVHTRYSGLFSCTEWKIIGELDQFTADLRNYYTLDAI